MSSDPILEDAYLSNGELNISYILSNANLLMKSGEFLDAISLFRLVKNHPKFGFCGHYGLGQCFLKMGQPEQAVRAFEKALSLQRRAYIAASLVEAFLILRNFTIVEKLTLGFAQEFVNDPDYLKQFRAQYQVCLKEQQK